MANDKDNAGFSRRDLFRLGRGKKQSDTPPASSEEKIEQSDIVDLIINGSTDRRGFLKTVSAWLLTPNVPLQPAAVPEMSVEQARRLIEMLQDPAVLALPTMLNDPQCLTGLLVGVKPGELDFFKTNLEGKVKMTELDAILNNRSVNTAQNLLQYAKQIRSRLQAVHEKQSALLKYIEKKTGQNAGFEREQLIQSDFDLKSMLWDDLSSKMPRLQKKWYTTYGQNADADPMLRRLVEQFSKNYGDGTLDKWVSDNFGAGHEGLVPHITNEKDYKARRRSPGEEKDFRIKELKELLSSRSVKIEINIALDGSMYKPTINTARITAPGDTLGIIQKTIDGLFPEAGMDRMEPTQGGSGAFDPLPSLSLREPPSGLVDILAGQKKTKDIQWNKDASKPAPRGYLG